MSARLIYSLLFLSISTHSISQSIADNIVANEPGWSFAYTAGYAHRLEPPRGFGNLNAGSSQIEISYVPDDKTGFFINYSKTSHELPGFDPFGFYSDTETYSSGRFNDVYLLTAGARLYTGNPKIIFFDIGGGPGGVVENDRELSPGIGLAAGLGVRAPLNNSLGIIFRGRLNLILMGTVYSNMDFNAGLELKNFNELVVQKNISPASVGIFFGKSGKEGKKLFSGIGSEFTYDVSDNFSLVASYSNRNVKENNMSEKDYAGGLRNYFGKTSIRFFCECLGNLNIVKDDGRSNGFYLITKNSIGMALGTGVEIKLLQNLSGVLKGNYTLLDNEDNNVGIFGGVKFKL